MSSAMLLRQRQLARWTSGNRSRGAPNRIACTVAPRLASISRRAKSKDELNDPAQIGASGHATSRFQVLPGYEPLQSYMLLPVEQYFVLDPKQIAHLGGNRFVLTVPRIKIFNIWLEAVVEVSVNAYPSTTALPAHASSNGNGNGHVNSNGNGNCHSGGPRVVLQAENCRISGSDAVESLRLDQRFAMRFVTELTWSTTPAAEAAASGEEAGAGGGAGAQTGEIRASSQLDVWSEVVSPFHLLPRGVLVATCNGVLRGLVSSLLPLFVRMLAQDYQRWAADPAYRAERAQRSQAVAV